MNKKEKARIRKAIFASREEWDYHGKERLAITTENMKMELIHYSSMKDPVAGWRPQILSSFYGYAVIGDETYEILVVIGTDEGLYKGFAPILIGTKESICKYVQRKQYLMIYGIIPARYKKEFSSLFKDIKDEVSQIKRM